MSQSWVVRTSGSDGNPALSDLMELPDEVFDTELGTLYAFGGGNSPPGSFGDTLKLYMKNENMTVEELAFRSGISERTIGTMRNRKGYRPKLENVVAICIAMHLNPSYSYRLIELAGYKLTDCDRDIIYRLLLDWAPGVSIEQCNKFLIRAHQTPF
ncbi:MAG: helix-turn-helix transcriptional regulator [Lachnospiraceae bacterium]|nr:helix-turn-helix transcriptional regulator [Lachnospiraceae bacterium]